MNLRAVNNFFGDMDLFLMDMILKGKVAECQRVLDVGCGEGRNAIYFIQQGCEYVGLDRDMSKLSLARYLTEQMDASNASFVEGDLTNYQPEKVFDLIICSRVLHFSTSEQAFKQSVQKLKKWLAPKGVLYLSMDSVVDNDLATEESNGMFRFPDGKVRFALTEAVYHQLMDDFEELEPLRTIIHHGKRAQSFVLLEKC